MEMEPFEWSKLPLELREMCVRKSDFATRMKLRRASRLDKWIVEAPHNRIKFDRLFLQGYEDIEVHLCIGKEYIISGNETKVESLSMSALKYSNIRRLELSYFETELFDQMTAVGAVIPQLWVVAMNDGDFHLALENFGEGVELFDLGWIEAPSNKSLQRVLRDPLLVPRFLQAKQIQFTCRENLSNGHSLISNQTVTQVPRHVNLLATTHTLSPTAFHTLIGLWIQNDKKLGSKLIVEMGDFLTEDDGLYDPEEDEKPIFASILEKFADRVVLHHEDEKEIRLATNIAEYQILIRIIHDRDTFPERITTGYTVFMVFQMIPATLEKKDYERTSGFVLRPTVYTTL